ncbi:MAG: FG-GAP repeat domain-containing protein [Thermoanaerobaculia bacterium]
MSLVLADLEGDGFPDLTTANRMVPSVSVALNRGPGGIAPASQYPLGFEPLGHRVADLDQDGALDLILIKSDGALVLRGRPAAARPPGFRRGDANGDRVFDVADPIAVL